MSRPDRPPRVASLVSMKDERGFTLVELIIVTTITPLIIGAIAIGLVQIFSLQGSISNRLQNSNDTQIINSTLSKDVENSAQLTTNPTSAAPAPCGVGTQLLGLQWNSGAVEVTYATVPNGTTTSVNLVRNLCVAGALSSSEVLAFNVSPSQVPPSVTCLTIYTSCVNSTPGSPGTASTGWLASSQVQEVTMNVSETTTSSAVPYHFALSAFPAQSLSTNPAMLGGPTTVSQCGFAVAGTGTYAAGAPQEHCFLDFSFLNNATNFAAVTSSSGIDVKEGAPNGYTIGFHMQMTMESSQQIVVGAPFWTYPLAFMGNNVGATLQPFYTGVGCAGASAVDATGAATKSCIDPAIYEQYNKASTTYANYGGTVVITLSNFTLLSPANTPVSGYEVVSMDAETTDQGEYLTWHVASPGSPYLFHLIANSPTSPIGNACNNTNFDTTTSSTNDLIGMNLDTGLSTGTTVTCQVASSANAVRTGTPMLGIFPDASNPPTLSITMHGTGLEGVGLALLVPN